MKNTSLLLNLVLLVAVGFLYYLHFSDRDKQDDIPLSTPKKEARIVFVDTDSMLSQYTYYKNKKAELKEKQDKIQGALQAEGKKLQNEAIEYQKNAGSMTGAERQQKEEELTMKQQMLMQKKDGLISQMEDEQNSSNDELNNRLTAFIKDYNKKKNYSYILGYKQGGGILFANDSLNVTGDVITGLNELFEKEQKEKK